MSVARTTCRRATARTSCSRRNPSRRDQSPMYGDGGHCAWSAPTRSIARGTESDARRRRSWRARSARFSSRRPRTRSRATTPRYLPPSRSFSGALRAERAAHEAEEPRRRPPPRRAQGLVQGVRGCRPVQAPAMPAEHVLGVEPRERTRREQAEKRMHAEPLTRREEVRRGTEGIGDDERPPLRPPERGLAPEREIHGAQHLERRTGPRPHAARSGAGRRTPVRGPPSRGDAGRAAEGRPRAVPPRGHAPRARPRRPGRRARPARPRRARARRAAAASARPRSTGSRTGRPRTSRSCVRGGHHAWNAASRSDSSRSSRRTARSRRSNGDRVTVPFSYRQVPATAPSTRNVGTEGGFFVEKTSGR